MRRNSPSICLLVYLLTTTCAGCAASSAPMASRAEPSYSATGFVDPGEMSRNLAAPAGEKPPAPAKAPEAPKPGDAPREARQVIYSAGFRVVVADVAESLRSIQAAAEKLGGHMQEVGGNSITVRVPAAQFKAAVRAIEEAGEVVDRQVKAQDVTEEMRDVRIRLDNAEQLRKRLLDILAKAEKVEDALKIEAELARVSEQIDAAKGKIRYMESQVAMSTLRAELNSPVPQNARGNGPRLPFAWVEQLGGGLVAGQVQQEVRKAGFFSRGPAFKPPATFVRYYEEESQTDAMDAAGLLIRVQRRPNVDKAGVEFWSKLIRKSLVEGRALAITNEETPGGKTYLIRGTRDLGGKPVGYLMAVKRTDRWVTIFEAWGPKDLHDQNWEALRASALSIEGD